MGVTPLVSVCIQTYQHASFIRQCIDSALSQKCDFPFEIIIGEDHSTDGTRAICQEYAHRHPEIIRLFLRSHHDRIFINGQQTGRFNFIENMKAARGKYIALLDGDDFWCDTRKLEKQVNFMEAHEECSVCFHDGYRCDSEGKTWVKKEDRVADEVSVFDSSWLYSQGGNPFLTSTCIFRRETISEIPKWFYEVPFLDYALHMHNAGKGKIGFIPEKLSVYRIHSGGMWSSPAAPANRIRLWHFYTVLAKALAGEAGASIQKKRYQTGENLVRFYRTHRGFDPGWLKEDLKKNLYAHDSKLLQRLNQPPGPWERILLLKNEVKKRLKKIMKAGRG